MAGKVWATDPNEELPIKVGSSGVTARTPKTVYEVFQETVMKYPDQPAVGYKDLSQGTSAADAPWKTLTWSEYYLETLRFGKSLMSLGLAPSGVINIIGFNSVEWFVANLGVIAAGGVAAGIYTTNLPQACKYVSEHSKAEVIVVENEAQLAKYAQVAAELTAVKAIVMYRGDVPEGTDLGFPVYRWDQFMELGSNVPDADIEERIKGLRPGKVCTLIYTSGTTGPPKAVMISHDNFTWTASVIVTQFQPLDSHERSISYLPLSHVAAQLMDIHASMAAGCCVYFAQPDALKGSLVKTLKEVRPTIFLGIPRVWEKMYEKMQDVGRSLTGVKKRISTWSKAKGLENARAKQWGGSGKTPWGFYIADKLAFSTVKTNLGLDKTKLFLTAAAPISTEVMEYFASLNMHIFEIFGQSECTGPHTHNRKDAWKIGSVGRPLPGTESKLMEGNGELCYRGRHIFMGYMYDPEKTAQTIDEDGWMYSGDVATFDGNDDPDIPPPSGFMHITGRIKELLITAGGENIPPVLIEDEFKKEMPCISNCMVIGDKRKFLSIIIALRVEVDADGVPTNKLAGESLATGKDIGSTATTVDEVKSDPKWKEYLDKGLKACNQRTTSNAQRIIKWGIIPTDFSVDGGELTPTLKLKRGPTHDKYLEIIEAFYA